MEKPIGTSPANCGCGALPEAHARAKSVALVRNRCPDDEVAAVARYARVRRRDRVGRSSEWRHPNRLPSTQFAEHRFRCWEVDIECAATVELRNRRSRVDTIAGVDLGQPDMARKGRANDAVVKRDLRLPKGDPGRCERCLPRLDLAIGDRTSVLDPAVTRKQLLGLAHLDARGFHSQAFTARVHLDQRLALAHELAGREQHARDPPVAFRKYLCGRCSACGAYRLKCRPLGQRAQFLSNNRDPLALVCILRFGARAQRGRQGHENAGGGGDEAHG